MQPSDNQVSNGPIHKWHEGDRPREKLLKSGPSTLSDAELIALVFGSGTRTKLGTISAVHLGQTIMKRYNSLRNIATRDHQSLMELPGIGPAKAAQLCAVFEMSRRIESEPEEARVQIRSPEDIAGAYGPHMRDLKKEIFKVVILNTANVIVSDYTISEGGLAASIVEPRAVFQRAIMDNAASIICLHNHPSGNPEPSREDIRVTRQLVEAGKIMGIPVHDHLIIAGKNYTSLAERGLMNAL